MKQLIAIVKPFLAEAVLRSLLELPLADLIVREVRGYGRQRSYLDQYQAGEYAHIFTPKVEITAWIEDDATLERAIAAVTASSRTGRLGDGKILVLPVVGAPPACFPGHRCP